MNLHGLTVEQLEVSRGWNKGAECAEEGRQLLSLSSYALQAQGSGKTRAAQFVERVDARTAPVGAFADGLRAGLAHHGWSEARRELLALRAEQKETV